MVPSVELTITDGALAVDTLRRLFCDLRRDRRFCATDPPALLSYTFMAGIFPGAAFGSVSFVPVRLIAEVPGTGLFSSRRSDRFACSLLELFDGVSSLRFNHGPDFVADRANSGVIGAFMADPPPLTRRERLPLMMEDDFIIEWPALPGVRPTDEIPSNPFAFFRALEI